MGGGTGFAGDDFGGRRYDGLYVGRVVKRDDPDMDGRVRIQIPGVLDEPSAWAKPMGGGSPLWGHVAVPPLGADVYVQFINGRLEQPVYQPADYGVRGPKKIKEIFPEYEDPDVIVAGYGPFRIVIDLRNKPEIDLLPSLRIKMVHTSAEGAETDTAWVQLSENSVQVYSDSALQIKSGALLDLDSEGDVQLKRRKVMPTSKPISG